MSDGIDFYDLKFEFKKTKSMYENDYKNGKWGTGKLIPFRNIEISPGACILNYGQGIFEGMKALQTKNGKAVLFRPLENAKRFNKSADRLLMPNYDEKEFVKAIKEVVKANKEFIPPYDSGGALYIRPLMIGNGPILGVKPAKEYKFLIFTVPVGPYFPEGFQGIDLKITKKYTRAAPGGTGDAKTCSNYAGTMKPAKEAKEDGFAQVIYLDAVEKEYIEEVGTANFFALIEDTLVTPRTRGTILPGITRRSILKLASEKFGIKIEERDVSYKEIFKENCKETFCTGTAAVITPISSITFEEETRTYNGGKPGELTTQLYNELTGIQRLDREDPFNWIVHV